MKRHQPALLGGVFIGVLSALPVVGACCCLWMLGGGALTVYLQQQARVEPVEVGDAMIGGLIAGLVGAVIATMATILMLGANGALLQEQVQQSLDQMNQLPPETRATVERVLAGSAVGVIIGVFNLFVYPAVAMLGALLGVAIFRKKTPPTTPPVVPPAPLS